MGRLTASTYVCVFGHLGEYELGLSALTHLAGGDGGEPEGQEAAADAEHSLDAPPEWHRDHAGNLSQNVVLAQAVALRTDIDAEGGADGSGGQKHFRRGNVLGRQ